MITVIIPALHEQATNNNAIKFCFNEPLVTEVIIVDDQSVDNSMLIAKGAGANVLISKIKGKGFSMKEGILAASNQLLVFLNAAIDIYPTNTIRKLVQPLIDNDYDFVEGAFNSMAECATEVVAKPLLNIFCPELCQLPRPLSGLIAGKKSFLNKIDFFHDYGVDIGILKDMFLRQSKIKEVNIAYIQNKSNSRQMLSKMSTEVATQ